MLVGVSIAACDASGSPPVGWQGSIDTLRDSVTVRTSVDPDAAWPKIDSASAEIVWRSDELARPQLVTANATGDTLLIADRDRIFVLGIGGMGVTVLGRPGQGPGEFRRIDGISGLYGDSLLVWDGALWRLTWLGVTGDVIRTLRITPPGKYRAPRRLTLHPLGTHVLLASSFGLVSADGVPDTVVVGRAHLESGVVNTLASIEDLTWRDVGGFLGPRYPYGPRALYAVSPSGRLAVSTGVEYCVLVMDTRDARLPFRICRVWRRQPVGNAASPPSDLVDSAIGRLGPMLRQLVLAQDVGEHKNSLDVLHFDHADRLWVRVVDATHRHHPAYMGQMPSLRDPTYLWEIFQSDGKLAARIRLPSRFRPLWITEDVAFGLWDEDDGTVSIARAKLPRIGF